MLVSLERSYGSPQAVAEAYALRFECDYKGAARVLRRIRERQQEWVNLDTLDRLCLLGGTHIELVLWSEA